MPKAPPKASVKSPRRTRDVKAERAPRPPRVPEIIRKGTAAENAQRFYALTGFPHDDPLVATAASAAQIAKDVDRYATEMKAWRENVGALVLAIPQPDNLSARAFAAPLENLRKRTTALVRHIDHALERVGTLRVRPKDGRTDHGTRAFVWTLDALWRTSHRNPLSHNAVALAFRAWNLTTQTGAVALDKTMERLLLEARRGSHTEDLGPGDVAPEELLLVLLSAKVNGGTVEEAVRSLVQADAEVAAGGSTFRVRRSNT